MCYYYECDWCHEEIYIGCLGDTTCSGKNILGDPSLGSDDCEKCGDLSVRRRRSIGWKARLQVEKDKKNAHRSLEELKRRSDDTKARYAAGAAAAAAGSGSRQCLVGI